MDRRTAISGLIPARPFRMADRVLRLTPKASAACVTVTPSGSKQRALMISPGWGGLYMRIATTSLVIVLVIHGIRILAHKLERHPPVPADRHGPGALSVTFERMKVKARQRHISRSGGGTQTAQDETKSFSVLCLNA